MLFAPCMQYAAPWGRSVYQVHGEYALLRDLPDVEFEIAEVLDIDGARFEEIVEFAQRIERRPQEFQEFGDVQVARFKSSRCVYRTRGSD